MKDFKKGNFHCEQTGNTLMFYDVDEEGKMKNRFMLKMDLLQELNLYFLGVGVKDDETILKENAVLKEKLKLLREKDEQLKQECAVLSNERDIAKKEIEKLKLTLNKASNINEEIKKIKTKVKKKRGRPKKDGLKAKRGISEKKENKSFTIHDKRVKLDEDIAEVKKMPEETIEKAIKNLEEESKKILKNDIEN